VIEELSAIETIQNEIGHISPEPKDHTEKETIKIDKLYDGTEHVRKCGDCKKDTSSSHWNTDAFVVGGHLCQKCYRRRRRNTTEELQARNIPPVRRCAGCVKSDQTSIWFKHPSIPYSYVCENCFSSIKSRTVPAAVVKRPAKRKSTTVAKSSKKISDPYPIAAARTLPLSQSDCLTNTLKPLYFEPVQGQIVLPSLLSLNHSIESGYQKRKAQHIVQNAGFPSLQSYFQKNQ
jgi:hypothetical protein